MRIAQTEVYTFAELSADAQKVAIKVEQQVQSEFFSFDTCDLKTICETVGVQNPEFSWTGFWCQGDGLSFTGEYSYATQALAKIKAYAPQDTDLHDIVAELQDLQKQHGYRLAATITRDHGCHYSHENSVTIQAFKSGDEVVIEQFKNCFKALMHHFYKMVQSEYESITSEEYARECLTYSDNEYTADGKIWV